MNANLSKNANQYLFPIREQKIILIYQERENEIHFVQAQIALKLEEVKLASLESILLPSVKKDSDQLALEPTITSSPATPQKSRHKKQPSSGGGHLLEETKRTPTKSASQRTTSPPSGKKCDRNSAASSTQKSTTPNAEESSTAPF